MDHQSARNSRRWQTADRIGAIAAFLCAIHCAALPFVLALVSLIGGYRRHHRPLSLLLALPGLALLLLGVTVAEQYSIAMHSVLVTCGGLLVAAGHFINLRSNRLHRHVHSPRCAHGPVAIAGRRG